MRLIARAQTFQNAHGLLFRGLFHRDRLESALQRCVLLNVLPVLLNRRRTDQLQFAARKRGLQNIACIHGALCGAGTDDCVNLIDEEQYISGLHHFLQYLFDTFLELTAVLGARNHTGEIQGYQTLLRQGLGNFTVYNELRQSLDHRGLTDPRLTDQAGIVLGSAAQNLHDTLHLHASSDDRIQLALARKLREIARILIERRCRCRRNTVLSALYLLRNILRTVLFSHCAHQIHIELLNVNAHRV